VGLDEHAVRPFCGGGRNRLGRIRTSSSSGSPVIAERSCGRIEPGAERIGPFAHLPISRGKQRRERLEQPVPRVGQRVERRREIGEFGRDIEPVCRAHNALDELIPAHRLAHLAHLRDRRSWPAAPAPVA
jgi:hypothetical protein